jgi:N-acyl-D-amino-acid deacylase
LIHTPAAKHKLLQGITTEVLGNCGLSVAPLPPDRRQVIQDYMAFIFGQNSVEIWPWSRVGEYLEFLQNTKPAVNALTLAAHGLIRLAVMGFDENPANPEQVASMQQLVAEAMEDGAYGISTGLQYAPGCFATIEELIQVTKVVGKYGGIYCTHMRSQSTGLLESVSDSIQIGRETNVPVQISHLLAMGKPNWEKYDAAHTLIADGRKEGLDITYDMYPYTAGCTMLRVVLPPWVMEGGNSAAISRLSDPAVRAMVKEDLQLWDKSWDNISSIAGWENLVPIQLSNPNNHALIGRSLQEIADLSGRDPVDSTIDLLVSEGMEGVMIAYISAEENVRKAVSGFYGMFGSDSMHTPEGSGGLHPRAYGAYPRYFAKYVRDENTLRLEEAVYKATGLPARRFGLQNRGLIREGMAADLIVFDPYMIEDCATYLKPRQTGLGMIHVIVNGKLALEDGTLTGVRAGRVLYATN